MPPSLCLPSSPWCLPNKLLSLFWVHPENVKSTRTFPLCTEVMGRALVLSPLDTFRSSPHSYSILCFTPVSDCFFFFFFFFTLEEKRWTPSEFLCLFLFFRTSQSAWGQQKFCRVKTHFLEPSFYRKQAGEGLWSTCIPISPQIKAIIPFFMPPGILESKCFLHSD